MGYLFKFTMVFINGEFGKIFFAQVGVDHGIFNFQMIKSATFRDWFPPKL